MQQQEVKTTDWPLNSVENALLKMSSTDTDYARQVNGVGFSKLDTQFGNSLADKLGQWGHLTFRQRAAAYKMLRKYRRQLLQNWGIAYELIPEPLEDEPAKTAVKGKVWLHDGSLIVDSPYNGALVNALRAVPTRRWEPDGKPASQTGQKGVWVVPLTIDNFAVIEKLVADFALDMEAEAKLALKTSQHALEEMVEGSKALDAEIEVPELGVTLLPFQKAGLAFARKVLETGGLYIADEMGLGKTVETLAIAEDGERFPMLVAVPKVVWLNWAREARKVLPNRTVAMLAPATVSRSMMRAVGDVRVITSSEDEDSMIRSLLDTEGRWIANIFVVSYNNLLKWSPALMEVPWKLVAYDEAHLLKSRGAQRTKAAQSLAKLAETMVCLSGTPIPNAPAELITQLNILGRLQDLGGFKRYWGRYCNGWDRGHANEEELNVKMRSTFYLRRTKRDVYPELPEVRWIDVPVPMHDPGHYERVEADLMHFIREKAESDDELLAVLKEIEDDDERAATKKALIDEKYERAMRAQVLTLINALRQVVAQEKMPAFYEWLDSWLETTTGNGHSLQGEASKKIIVFTDHRDIGKMVAERYSAPLIIGGMDEGRKSQYIQSFQDGNERMIVCAIQAAGLGITLTAASDVVFLEYPWRPMDMDQAVSRTYGRVNDLHGATAYQIIAPATIDDRMLEKISEKRDTTGKVTDGSDDSVFGAVLRGLIKEARG